MFMLLSGFFFPFSLWIRSKGFRGFSRSRSTRSLNFLCMSCGNFLYCLIHGVLRKTFIDYWELSQSLISFAFVNPGERFFPSSVSFISFFNSSHTSGRSRSPL